MIEQAPSFRKKINSIIKSEYETYEILKRVEGEQVEKGNANYAKIIEKIAESPQKTFFGLIKEVDEAFREDYLFDFMGKNLFVDSKNKKFNPIDYMSKKEAQERGMRLHSVFEGNCATNSYNPLMALTRAFKLDTIRWIGPNLKTPELEQNYRKVLSKTLKTTASDVKNLDIKKGYEQQYLQIFKEILDKALLKDHEVKTLIEKISTIDNLKQDYLKKPEIKNQLFDKLREFNHYVDALFPKTNKKLN